MFQWLQSFPYCSLLWVSEILPKTFNLRNTRHKSNRQTLYLSSDRCGVGLPDISWEKKPNHVWKKAKPGKKSQIVNQTGNL